MAEQGRCREYNKANPGQVRLNRLERRPAMAENPASQSGLRALDLIAELEVILLLFLEKQNRQQLCYVWVQRK